MTSSKAASFANSGARPFRSRKTTVASHAKRLFPSTSARLRARECNNAAALSSSVAYASSPKALERDRAAAESSSPTSRTGPACRVRTRPNRSSRSWYSASVKPCRGARAHHPIVRSYGSNCRVPGRRGHCVRSAPRPPCGRSPDGSPLCLGQNAQGALQLLVRTHGHRHRLDTRLVSRGGRPPSLFTDPLEPGSGVVGADAFRCGVVAAP